MDKLSINSSQQNAPVSAAGLLPFLESPDAALLALVAGMSICLVLPALVSPFLLLALAAAVCMLVRIHRAFIVAVVLLLALGWASWNFNHHLTHLLPAALQRIDLTVDGVVEGLPKVDSRRSALRLRIKQLLEIDGQAGSVLDTADADVLVGQLVQLNCYRCSLDPRPGERWQLTIRLKQPHGYASWGAFDYEKYLFRDRVVATGYVRTKHTATRLAGAGWSADSLRWAIAQSLQQVLPSGTVAQGMFAALMIGDKSALSTEQKEVFQQTGLSHLLAISGLHIGLVFAAMLFICRWLLLPLARLYNYLPRQHLAMLAALAAAFCYAALAGFAVSTQRALIMLSVLVVCRFFARPTNLLRILLISVAIILLHDPFSILDIGFWLSFGAVLVIALATESEARLSLLRLQPVIWLGMLPLTVLFFGQASMISPLVNLVMVPLFCSVLIPLVLIAMLAMQVAPSWAAQLLNWLAILFEQIFAALQWLSKLPMSQWYPPQFDSIDWLLLSILLGVYLLPMGRILRLRLLLWPCLFLSLYWTPNRLVPGQVEIALLDVGQGLSMVARTARSTTVYDTGPAWPSGFSAARAVLIPYLRASGVASLDTLVISHADNDHIGGYPHLLEHYQPRRVYTSRTDRVPHAENCRRGQQWQVDGVTFEILSPDSDTPSGSNNRSCVMRISTGATRLLITGDIEKPVENYLLSEQVDLDADIMLVPHQGSKTSSTSSFIEHVDPALGLIAAGFANHYGHPHQQVVKRYQERDIALVSTIEGGTIKLLMSPDGWRKTSYRSARQRFWRPQKKPNRETEFGRL